MRCVVRSFLGFDFFRVFSVITTIIFASVPVSSSFRAAFISFSVVPSNVFVACFVAALAAIVSDCFFLAISFDHSHKRRTRACNNHLSARPARAKQCQSPVSLSSYTHTAVPTAQGRTVLFLRSSTGFPLNGCRQMYLTVCHANTADTGSNHPSTIAFRASIHSIEP